MRHAQLLIAFLVISLTNTACAPKYQPPLDRFELSNASYAGAKRIVDRIFEHASPVANSSEQAPPVTESQIEVAIEALSVLAKEDHIPSQFLIDHLTIQTFEAATAALKDKKKRREMRVVWKSKGQSEKQYIEGLRALSEDAWKSVTKAAEAGYGQAQSLLIKYQKPAPAVVTRQTRAEIQALARYQTELAEYNQRMENVTKGIAGLALVGLAAYGASQAPASTGGGSPGIYTFNDDHQGCCSWHGGIARNYFGQPQCTIWRKVQCKDGQPSPTCTC